MQKTFVEMRENKRMSQHLECVWYILWRLLLKPLTTGEVARLCRDGEGGYPVYSFAIHPLFHSEKFGLFFRSAQLEICLSRTLPNAPETQKILFFGRKISRSKANCVLFVIVAENTENL